MLSLKCLQCKFIFSLKYPSPDLARLSIESSVAREINFDIVIRNYAGKKARKAHFSKKKCYIYIYTPVYTYVYTGIYIYIVQVNIKILKNIIIKSLKIDFTLKELNGKCDLRYCFICCPHPTKLFYIQMLPQWDDF
jgi:hypothetical protein